ncbi:hypothetical protein DID88_010326 [Monilinia fructigena]|uniref:Uncharacterized protein n=1 Tax=Monilinia fructigena TaxID=38457 RepID=A0A395ILU2_9HELO|nr:hypothetical protein DID88_010326 [Monilinia fructigena]
MSRSTPNKNKRRRLSRKASGKVAAGVAQPEGIAPLDMGFILAEVSRLREQVVNLENVNNLRVKCESGRHNAERARPAAISIPVDGSLSPEESEHEPDAIGGLYDEPVGLLSVNTLAY